MFKKISNFLKEVKIELKKVTWPTKNEAIKLTIMVIIGAGIIAGLIAVFDYIFLKSFEFFVNF